MQMENNWKNIFINKSKSPENNQHFFLPHDTAPRQLQTKETKKHIHTSKLWKQFGVSRQNINMHNPKLSPNLKQPPTLAYLNYPNYKL